jgi:predicted nucleotidyltransferase
VDGRHVYYRANKGAPIFPELERLVMKTIGLSDLLREALEPLTGRIDVAVVLGSAARGQLKPERDVGFLLIGDVQLGELAGALAAMRERLGRPVKPTVWSRAEFRKKVADDPPFLPTLLSESHLFVIGGPDELQRLGARDLRSPRRRRARLRRPSA